MSSNLIRGTLALTGALLLTSGVSAADEGGRRLIMQSNDAIAASDLKWSESRTVPPGVKMVMLFGDPSKPGPYVFRAQFPAGYKLPAHRHADQRSVTVLKGMYWSGVGESFDQDKLRKFGPRDYYITEARVPHFSWAETEVIIQEMGLGPLSNPIEYVNTADDPRK